MKIKNRIIKKTFKTASVLNFKLSTIIFIVFLIFKLGKIGVVADWSWLWVTCPLWMSWALLIGFFAAIFAIFIAFMFFVGLLSVIFK